MDARFGPWQTLRSFQERVLGGGSADHRPAPPEKWWGRRSSDWFREEGLARTPFNGFYLDDVTVASRPFPHPAPGNGGDAPPAAAHAPDGGRRAAGRRARPGGQSATGVFIGIALDLNSTNFSLRWSLQQKAAAWAARTGARPHRRRNWRNGPHGCVTPPDRPLNANRTMGALGNIVASRIAREFRIGGPSFTLSCEENSGMGPWRPRSACCGPGELDRALVGAVDLAGDLRAVLGQHAVQPFSAPGQALPFDAEA